MQNQTTVAAVVMSPTKTFDFNNYTLNVSGDPTKGARVTRISVPILDANGARIDMCTLVIKGADFNAFWTTFTSDKQVAAAVLAAQGLSADVSQISDSIVNVVK